MTIKNILKQKLLRLRISNKEVYFVVSTGRTGTKFMESFLNNASQKVCCLHEPYPDLFNISVQKYRAGKSSLDIQQLIFSSREQILNKLCKSSHSILVESNPFASFLVDDLRAVFPKAKFVIIYRDIASYLLSALNKSPLNNNINNFYGDSDKRVRINPSDFEGDSSLMEWNNYSQAQKITWYWNKCNHFLHDFAQRNNTDSVLSLKFEALFSSDIDEKSNTIREVLDFMGIKYTDQKMKNLIDISKVKRNATKDLHHSSYDELVDLKKWIANHTHEVRSKLGYENFINSSD
jgi:hypothetical protein